MLLTVFLAIIFAPHGIDADLSRGVYSGQRKVSGLELG